MTKWLDETGGTRGDDYDAWFEALAASGEQVHGEADFVSQLVPPCRVLDAGCGTGRLAIELARRGYVVVGVDSDASMLAVAQRRAPDLTWRLQDLVDMDEHSSYDVVVAAGNVMVYLAEGTGPAAVAAMAKSLRPGGLLVTGWRTERAPDDDRPKLAGAAYDGWAAEAGLSVVDRFATWDGDPLTDDAEWCVTVDRKA